MSLLLFSSFLSGELHEVQYEAMREFETIFIPDFEKHHVRTKGAA